MGRSRHPVCPALVGIFYPIGENAYARPTKSSPRLAITPTLLG